MSMKRTKKATQGSSKDSDGANVFGFGKVTVAPTWVELTTDQPDGAFKPYAMNTTFAKGELVLHPKFGKGVVTLVEMNRIEILFEDAVRKLGHAAS
ncbi:MAG: hypothetical protein WCJ30_01030 [Deltaproteobacteria bacterium]